MLRPEKVPPRGCQSFQLQLMRMPTGTVCASCFSHQGMQAASQAGCTKLAGSRTLTWRWVPHRPDGDEDDDEQTVWERVTGVAREATRKLTDWGVISPRLMLAGGGLFMTLSNWGLLPSVRSLTTFWGGLFFVCISGGRYASI